MTTIWTPIDPTADIAIKKPITFEHGRLFYNNPIAIAEGADGAPRVSRRAIAPGGSEIDGDFIDGTAAPTAIGFYELLSMNLAVNKTFPYVSIIRVAGDVTLSAGAVLTIDHCDSLAEQSLADMIGVKAGTAGSPQTGPSEGAGGGAALGNGGRGSTLGGLGATGLGTTTIERRWLAYKMVGGLGGANGDSAGQAGGGGVCILIIQGDLDLSGGGAIKANGQKGFGSAAGGGGGGGTLIVLCTGTVTDGTFEAKGGDGGDDISGTNSGGGGGGGGYVAVVAAAYAGVQALSAAGGARGDGGGTVGVAGTAGVTEKITLTEAQINGILLR